MTESFEQLDPNYVIAIDYSIDNLTEILTELCAKGLHVLSRPGHDKNTVYVFTRVETRDVQKNINDEGKISIETSEETGEEVLHRICRSLGFVKSITRIHDAETRKKLYKTSDSLIKKLYGLPSEQELVQVEKLTQNARQALYFAFFKTYIIWLVPLSFVGILTKLFHTSTPWEFNIPYTVFLMVWSLLFASSWVYKTEPYYSAKFGKVQNNCETNETDLSTPSEVLYKKFCFLPVALLFVASLISFQFLCFFIEIFITQFYAGPLGSVFALLPTVLICSFIPILTMIYNKIFVDRLVEWENGPNPLRSKVEKNFILTFFTSYVPLLITLFVYLPLGYKITPEIRAAIAEWTYKLHIPIHESEFVIDVNRYRNQFFYFTVTNQVIAFALENLLPIVQGRVMQFIKNKTDKNGKDSHSAIASTIKTHFPRELSMWQRVSSYHTTEFGSFDVDDNFKKVIIQFGYLSIFSTIWPLAPLMCFIFSFFTFKADLWRALKKCRPSNNPNDILVSGNNPNADPVSASPWDSVLSAISWIGATAGPTLLVMYRYCGLPGVGIESKLSKRDLWYRHSPLPYSWTTILLIAIMAEHVAVLLFAYFRNLFIASKQTFVRGFVPATDLQEPPQIDLISIVKQTTSLMNDISGISATENSEVSKAGVRSENGVSTSKPASGVRQNDGSQPLARNISPNIEPKSAQEVGSSDRVAVTKLSDKEEAVSSAQPKPVAGIAAKTTPNESPAALINQGKKEDVSTTGDGVLSASPSTLDELQEKSIPSQTKSAHESISSAAGATLPATIPTSKNYHLRFDSNGNPIAPGGSAATSEASSSKGGPQRQDLEKEKKEATTGVAHERVDPTEKSPQVIHIEPERSVATEAHTLDPARALNTIPRGAREELKVLSSKKSDAEVSLAADAAAAALASHSHSLPQTNAVQQFSRDVSNSIKSGRTTETAATDNQRSSLHRSNSVKSKTMASSHSQYSNVSNKATDGNKRRTSFERKSKDAAGTSKDHKSKHKKNLLHKLKKKL